METFYGLILITIGIIFLLFLLDKIFPGITLASKSRREFEERMNKQNRDDLRHEGYINGFDDGVKKAKIEERVFGLYSNIFVLSSKIDSAIGNSLDCKYYVATSINRYLLSNTFTIEVKLECIDNAMYNFDDEVITFYGSSKLGISDNYETKNTIDHKYVYKILKEIEDVIYE